MEFRRSHSMTSKAFTVITYTQENTLKQKGQKVINRMMLWCAAKKLNLSALKTVTLQQKGKYDRLRPVFFMKTD